MKERRGEEEKSMKASIDGNGGKKSELKINQEMKR